MNARPSESERTEVKAPGNALPTSEVDWLLNEEKGFVLFFRPRCGSTTLTRWFFENTGTKFGGFSISAYRVDWLNERLEQLQAALSERYDELHKFVVVRNPFERAISSYLHVVNHTLDGQFNIVKPYVPDGVGKHDLTFRQWVRYLEQIDLDTSHILWRRQSALSCWTRGVDDIVKLDSMNDYLLEMNHRFDLTAQPTFNSVTVPKSEMRVIKGWFRRRKLFADVPFRALLEFKGKAHFKSFPDYSLFYDSELRSAVEDLYRDDIAIFARADY